ncbi:archaeosortase B, VPXXXP-CTERM-specific [Methanolobus vulcani]|jgi:archaeosortase B (VPXXXP-CTERM-specific)|uniref:Archaeosortase B, VPXXXP-CTERM-specific n=1 Tax=Methanolobus vulcani TaxID=38026 RepID=A0A7Z7FCV2_9EURY|nr:archaeosortase B [Methanolobus vulcani]SDF97343.1 archaeosortase B, VPXXXP-CTERM-specific [Methanolobus vulcani]
MVKQNRKPKGTRKSRSIDSGKTGDVGNKSQFKVFLKRNEKVLRFIGPYLFYIALFTLVYITFQEKFAFLNLLTADALSVLMSFLGIESSSYGQSVYMDGFSVMIIDECTGMYELLVYAGCILAYPTTLKKKLLGLALGIPAMLGVNMVRLIFLSFVGIIYPSMFSYVHYYLWQITFIFLIVMFMLLWIEKVVKNPSVR